jgi:hypothetical protein
MTAMADESTRPEIAAIPIGFLLNSVIGGVRYAVRPQSVAIIHGADECRDETIVQLHVEHAVRVPCTLDEVLAWIR